MQMRNRGKPAPACQERRLAELKYHEIDQRADRGEGRTVDFVILDGEPEPPLQAC